MNDDELINRLLNDLYNAQREVNVYGYLKILGIDNKIEATRIMRLMKANELANPTGAMNISISDFGMRISKDGGWLKFLETQKNEEDKRVLKDQLETEQAKSNIEANKRNKKYLLFNLILTIINIIAVIITVLIALKSK